jgi:uncharacterized phiE125 gp8 family phage protein
MTLMLITAPTAEPVTLAEAKAHLRVDTVADDALIGMLIQSARQAAEQFTGRALITQTWERVLHAFPDGAIKLGMPPVASITSLKYIDIAGVEQTYSSAGYTLDAVNMPGWLYPSVAYPTWPSTQADAINAVRVRFACGYGATGSTVPATVRSWMLLRIGTLYEHRQEVIAGISLNELPTPYTERLLDRERAWSY